MKKQTALLCLAVALCSIGMALVDGVLQPGYLCKSAIKIVLFFGVPLCLSRFVGFEPKKPFLPRGKALVAGGILGCSTLGIILLAYFCVGGFLDLSGVVAGLESSAGVTKDNFLFVSTYIALCNSLLEEFFFRCFAFLGLKHAKNRVFAHCFSAAAFSLYHTGMLITMLPPLLSFAAMAALFLCGILFNYLNEKQETIYTSWLVHMGANLGINAIGMFLMGIL